MKVEVLSLDSLPESEHPVAQPSYETLGHVLDRYFAAERKPENTRSHDDWAIITAVREAAPDLAFINNQVNYYGGNDDVPQLRPPVQGGNVNQS